MASVFSCFRRFGVGAGVFFLFIHAAYATDLAPVPNPFVNVARRVRFAVVSISTTSSSGQEISGSHLRRNPSSLRYGSGIILDVDGHVLTNNHVINEAISIRVALSSGEEYPARVVGQDPDTDLALIRLVSPEPILPDRTVRLGNSDSVQVGDWVMAVGSPFGFHHTISVGVISAKGRRLDRIEGEIPPPSYQDFLQTDASINPGNSGGPLVDLAGRVVGINTAYNPGGAGIGFAIPINLAARIADELRQRGEVVRGFLGIYPQDLTADLAEALDLPSFQGVLVGEIQSGSPAEESGILRGDVLLTLAGRPLTNSGALLRQIAEHRPGQRVEFSVLRNGDSLVLPVTLGRRVSGQPAPTGLSLASSATGWPGLEISNRWELESRRLRVSRTGQGVVVTYIAPGGAAEKKGIVRGDIILEIDGVAIWNIRDYQNLIETVQNHSKPVLFLIMKKEDGHTRFVAFRPER